MGFSVRRGLAWLLFSQGGLFIVQFGGSVAISRLLNPHEMGIYAIAYATAGLIGTLRASGMVSFIIREPHLTPAAIRTSFTINAILALLAGAAILGISFAGGILFGDPGVQAVLQLLALAPVFGIFDFLPAARLERAGAFRTLSLVGLGKVISGTTVTIWLAAQGYSYMSIAWGHLTMAVFSVLVINIVGYRFINLRPGLEGWRRITRFGAQLFTVAALGNIGGRMSDLILGRLVGLTELGLYSRGAGLNGLLWDNVHMVIARIVFVDFAERRRRALPLRESYLRIVAMITGLLWPAFAGMAVLAGPVIETIYGPKWIGAALPLSILSIASLIQSSVTMLGEIYIVSGETNSLLRYEVRRFTISLSLFSLGCIGGLIGAAFSRIGEAMAIIGLCRKDLNRITETHTADFTPIYLQSLFLTALACAPAAVLMGMNGWSETTSLPMIFASIGVGIAAWALGLWWMRHPLFKEAELAGRGILRGLSRGTP